MKDDKLTMAQEKKTSAKTAAKSKKTTAKKSEVKMNPLKLMDEKCKNNFGCEIAEATKQQIYQTLCMVVRDILADKNTKFRKKVNL